MKVAQLPPLQVTLMVVITFFSRSLFAAENPCKSVQGATNVESEPIFCIGRLKKKMMIVTKSLDILMLDDTEIDQNTSQSAINSIYFGDAKPVPIDKMWPDLVKTKEYKDVYESEIPTCNPAIDKNGEYLLLDSNFYKNNKITGVRWDINERQVKNGFKNIHHNDSHTRFLSSSDGTSTYAITDKLGYLQIVQYKGCDESGKFTNIFDDAEAGEGPVIPNNDTCKATDTPPYRKMCKDGDTQVYVATDNTTDCKTIDWPVFTGFVDHGTFYFFGKDTVYRFPEAAYTKSEPSTFEKVNLKDFIKCGVNPVPNSWKAKKSPAMIGLIVALALILLICCLCILLCLVREAMARRKKAKKGGKGEKGKEKGGGGFFAPTTARSGALLSPGNLSKKFSGASKRSVGGLSPGKKLTKAVSGGGATKRSSSKAAGGRSLSRKGTGSTKRSTGLNVNGSRKRKPSRGPSQGVTGRSKMTVARSASKGRRPSRHPSAHSNKATERSKLKNH